MSMFEFSEIEAKLVLGQEWTLGAVRVNSDVIALSRGAPVDVLELVMRRHMNLDVGELQCDSCVHDAISSARDSARKFVTRYFLFGRVVNVQTNPALRTTEVTFAFEDELGEDSFETTFFNVLLERTETE